MDFVWKQLQNIGNYAVKVEQICDELRYAKRRLMSAISDLYVDVNENVSLKQENEELKKQLADVEMFKQCIAMMQQSNHVADVTPTSQTQIGEPL